MAQRIAYKGFHIAPVYHVGSDFTMLKDGSTRDRRPTAKDIAYYEITDPMEGGSRLFAENTRDECKQAIDHLLVVLDMKDNLPQSWAKLDG